MEVRGQFSSDALDVVPRQAKAPCQIAQLVGVLTIGFARRRRRDEIEAQGGSLHTIRPSATTGSARYASSPGPEYKESTSSRWRSINTPYADEPGSRTRVARFPMRIVYPGRAAGRTLVGCTPLDRSASASMNRP